MRQAAIPYNNDTPMGRGITIRSARYFREKRTGVASMAASSRGVALSGGLGRLHPESASEVHVLLYNSAIYRIAIFSPVCRRLRTFYGWLLQHETAPLDFFYI